MAFILIFTLIVTQTAKAQMVVSAPDVTGMLGVNNAQKIIELANQAIQMKRDLDYMIKQGKRLFDLGWDSSNLKNYANFIRQIHGKYSSTLRNFEAIDKDFSNKNRKGESFSDRHKKWDAMTENSIRESLRVNGVVSRDESKNLALDQLIKKLGDSENTLQASQAIGNILQILSTQIDALTKLIAADSEAKQVEMAKTHSKKMDAKAYNQHLARDWGKRKYQQKMTKMPNFSSK